MELLLVEAGLRGGRHVLRDAAKQMGAPGELRADVERDRHEGGVVDDARNLVFVCLCLVGSLSIAHVNPPGLRLESQSEALL